MLSLRSIGFAAACIAGAAFTSSLLGCGSDAAQNRDFGEPPEAGFNPGPGAGGDGYGSGGNQGPGADGGFDAAPATCTDDLKRCREDFTYPFNGETSVELRGDFRDGAWTAGEPMVHTGASWVASHVEVPYGKPVHYKFFVNGTTWKVDTTKPTETDATNNTNNVAQADSCTDFVCIEPPPTEAGVFDWRDSVIYFAFVDRFVDGNAANNCNVAGTDPAGNFKGGDWVGLTSKITSGYFTDLGVNTLWITVPLKNADTFAGHGTGADSHMYSSYHGYWPSDPTATESCYGTPAELKALVDAAHAKSLKVLFDYAMVHVQIGSAVYTQHNDWFWPNASNGHDCICGQGCDWNTDAQRCWFTDYLPHWNYTNAAARDFSVNAAVALVKQTGADGFRLDAIKHVDGSWLTQLRSDITSQIIATQTPKQRFYMVGETYDFGNQAFIRSFVDPATKLDGQFDFPLRLHLAKATLLRQEGMDGLEAFMNQNEDYYGTTAVMSTFVGNHDLPRSIHLGQDVPTWTDPYTDGKNIAWQGQPQLPGQRSAFERLANAFAVLLTNKGAPLIYYGDEIGLPGAGDPDNRRMMQWTGLSADQSWLYARIKALNTIRAAHPALRRGHRTTVSVDGDLWIYKMEATIPTGMDTVYVAINRGDTDRPGLSGIPSGLTEVITATPATGPVTVPARQTRIFSN